MSICNSKMIQFMPANHSNTNHIAILIHSAKMYFRVIFIALLRCVAENVCLKG